jgi:hypothetical protein
MYNSRLTLAASSIIGAAVILPSTAMAALPTGAATAFTTLQEDALGLIDLAWPVVVAVTAGFIVLKLFKKSASKVG